MTESVAVKCRGLVYWIPTRIWFVARETFRQQYKRGVDVPTLARRIAHDLMPQSEEDYFSEERLRRCLLAHFGRKGGKFRASLPNQPQQLTLFEEA